ncbi:MAG: hypothetical protein CVV52_05155 [Spirochaetae bacterium HGW-Spirochaetae-8]|nr:MAG: hypothetical protein CVV52_05155 [Spirochaetae bacterium HGW-Spirochaetae-8]
MTRRTFCIDTNLLIQAKKLEYAFDLAPGFWSWITSLIDAGKICCAEAVYQEVLHHKEDDLSLWIKQIKKKFVMGDDTEDIQENFTKICQYVSLNYPKSAHLDKFLSGADPMIIAHAMTNGYVVVSHERRISLPQQDSKIKIPNICDAFNVDFMDPYSFFRLFKLCLKSDN